MYKSTWSNDLGVFIYIGLKGFGLDKNPICASAFDGHVVDLCSWITVRAMLPCWQHDRAFEMAVQSNRTPWISSRCERLVIRKKSGTKDIYRDMTDGGYLLSTESTNNPLWWVCLGHRCYSNLWRNLIPQTTGPRSINKTSYCLAFLLTSGLLQAIPNAMRKTYFCNLCLAPSF